MGVFRRAVGARRLCLSLAVLGRLPETVVPLERWLGCMGPAACLQLAPHLQQREAEQELTRGPGALGSAGFAGDKLKTGMHDWASGTLAYAVETGK